MRTPAPPNTAARLVFARLAFACAALVALFGTSGAQAQSAVDERAIIATVSALDAAIDSKDWPRVRKLLLDEVTLVVPGRNAERMAADALVADWQETFHEAKTTFRLRGGERVIFDGADSAVVRSRAQLLTNVDGIAGDDIHELFSDDHHELDRTDNGWRVRHYGFLPRLERGNAAVAQHRLTAAGEDVSDTGETAVEEPAAAPGDTSDETITSGEDASEGAGSDAAPDDAAGTTDESEAAPAAGTDDAGEETDGD